MNSKKQNILTRLPIDSVLELGLPPGYEPGHVFNFYSRDTLCVSERVSRSGIKKGVLLNDIPSVIDIEFDAYLTKAHCAIIADGELTAEMRNEAHEICLSLNRPGFTRHF